MSNKKFPYNLLANNKLNLDEDSDYSENEYKNKDYKIQKYEKFKPKPIIKKQSNQTLKGAENKVKYLLSIFLKHIESEENNSGIFKPVNTLKGKDKDSISIKKKRIKKINTATNNKLGRTNSYNNIINSDNDNKFSICKNGNIHHGEFTPKSSLFSNYNFHPKKVGFNLNKENSYANNLNVINNSDSKKDGNYIFKKKLKKKNSLKISNTIKNNKKLIDIFQRTNSYNSYNSDIFKKKKISSIESPVTNHRKILFNKKNSKKSNANNLISLIKKAPSQGQNNNYLNFKNEGIIINKNSYKNNDIKEHKKKKKITFKNIINNIVSNNIKKNKNNNNNININSNAFNESNINSKMSENSDYNMNIKSIDIKPLNNNRIEEQIKKDKNSMISSNRRKSSTIIKKEFSSLSCKKKSIDFTDLSFKNTVLKTSVKPKKTDNLKNSLEIKHFKRSETSIRDKNDNLKSKLRRLNTHFKSLKQQIKQSIILRPDEIKLSARPKDKDSINNSITKKINKSFSKKNKNNSTQLLNNILNYSLYKNKKSSFSNNSLLKIKNYNLGFINKNEIKNKNKSNKNNINLKDQFSEYTTSVKKLNTETEIQETEKEEKKESSKSVSSFSAHSIKRKNNVYYEKYRILIHKGNIYDSLDDEEFEDEEEINSLYIDPHSFLAYIFDSILFIFSIISLFIIPLYLAKNKDFCKKKFSLIDGINLFIECLYVIDLFLGFFRAYYNWEEQLIKKNKIIAFKYLTGWFIFDLIASFPVYSIIKINEPLCNDNNLSSNYYNTVLYNLDYLFVSNRLLKIMKIFWYNQAWKYFSNKLNDYWNLAKNIFLVLAALNYTACLYIFIARNTFPNWIFNSKLETKSFLDIYICAIYILIMALTTVGYGDITCYSLTERVFQLFLLIIGIMAYSWLISSFSNYIKKLNERSADYESKKSILDEIKITHKNLPDELYDRILRYLKFKNFHEKKLINIIFDCLPVGLKNNLISEMYKPIIKNFIFFKNFQNTDFIVRVILCFKPILAYKNDILVNEGDMIEDIMFVKRGVLSVELPINMTDPQENIDKYLNMPLLKIEKGPDIIKIGNSTIIQKNNLNYKNILNQINAKEKKEKKEKKKKKSNSFLNSSILGSSFNYTLSLGNNQTLSKKKTIKIETSYVKILGIRENEHFGDVLMFLEQRSPLRVRVRSKKCELFFLKKMDAVKISTSYQNIWRRINKTSVFNFEQIKKSIRKILEIYCSVKKANSSNEEDNSDDILAQEFGIKESGVGLHPQNFDLNNSALISKKNNNNILRKNHSLKDEQIINVNNIFKEKDINNDYFIINSKNINKDKKNCFSTRIEKKNFDLISTNRNKLALSSFSSSSSSSSLSQSPSSSNKTSSKNNINSDKRRRKSKRMSKKLIDAFKGNYKFYKGINNNDNIEIKQEKRATIIKEEPDNESCLTPTQLKYTNSIQKYRRISSLNKNILNTISVKKSFNEKEINPINEYEKENEEEELYNNKNSLLIKKDSSSINEWNKNNINFIYNNNDDSFSNSNSSHFGKEINTEIYPGEEINVNKEVDLLKKKIDLNKQEKINDLNSSMEYKNSKIEKLLKSCDLSNENCLKEIEHNNKNRSKSSNSSEKMEEKYNNLINENDNDNNSNKFNFCSNRNNFLNIKSNISGRNAESPINLKTNWDSKILSINNDISLQFDSSYENCNLISGEKLIKNSFLQNKLKDFLINEIKESDNVSKLNTNRDFIKKTNSLAEPMKFNGKSNLLQSTIRPIKRLSSSNLNYSNNLNNLRNLKTKAKRRIRNCSSLMSKRSRTINSNSQNLEHTSSFYDNNLKNRRNKDKFKTGIGAELFGNYNMNVGMTNRFGSRRINGKGLLFKNSTNNINKINTTNMINSSSKELQRRINKKRRNSLIITNYPNNKKKNESLLSQINFNIQKTNQNLNNPDEFYSSYFNFLLEGEIGKNNQKTKNSLFSTSMIETRKKLNRNRSYMLKK